MIKCKEDLLGKKVRYKGEGQYNDIEHVCKIFGILPASWHGCSHKGGNTVALIGHSDWGKGGEKLISGPEAYWEDNEDTMEEFSNLKEIPFSYFTDYLNRCVGLEGHVTMDELQEILHGEEPKQQDKVLASQYKYTPLEVESVFDLKEMFEKGEIYFRWCGNEEEGYDKITTENMLICRYEEGRLLKREEVKLEPKGGEWWMCNLRQSGFGKNTVVYRATDKVWSLPDESWGVVWKQEDVTPRYKMVKEEDKGL